MNHIVKKLILVSLSFSISSIIAAPATPAPTSTSNTATFIALIAPMQMGHLNPALKIAQQVKGTCATDSAADSTRADAWRCTADNSIYDPCFGDNDKVICLTSPWSNEVVELTVTKPLPNKNINFKPGQGTPWGLELANGEHCTLMTGATGAFAGMRANYACGKNGLVYGDIDKSSNSWRVFYQADNDVVVKQISVISAWY